MTEILNWNMPEPGEAVQSRLPPRVITDPRPPQAVFVSIWQDSIWIMSGAERIDFARIPHAREWAEKRGRRIVIRHATDPTKVKTKTLEKIPVRGLIVQW